MILYEQKKKKMVKHVNKFLLDFIKYKIFFVKSEMN